MEEILPEGWVYVRLSEITKKLTDGSHAPPKAQDSGQIMISAKNISNGQIDFENPRFINSEAFAKEDLRTNIRPNDVLLTIVGAIGRSAVVQSDSQRFTVQRSVAVIKPIEVHSKFLSLQLSAPRYQQYLLENAKGTAQKGIYLRKLSESPIHLPPLNEQKRIVNKIESLQTRSLRAREALAEVGPLLEQFRQSVLAAAFRGDLTADWRAAHPDVEPASVLLERIREERRQKWEAAELAKYEAKGKQPPKGWKDKYQEPEPPNLETAPTLSAGWAWAAAEEITKPFRPVIYGIIKPGPDTPGGVPYVRVTEMKTGTIDVANLKRCHPDRAAKFKRAELLTNDILVSKDGTIGKVALVPPELEGGNITQHVLRVSISDHLDPEFVALMIQSPFCQGWMTGELKGIALQGVNVGDFRLMPIPLATREEQEVIVKRTQSSLESITQLEDFFTESKSALTQLDQSILSKAFRGELVPQDPEDEPAAELLARIQAARTAKQATQKKRTTRRKTKTATTKKH